MVLVLYLVRILIPQVIHLLHEIAKDAIQKYTIGFCRSIEKHPHLIFRGE